MMVSGAVLAGPAKSRELLPSSRLFKIVRQSPPGGGGGN